MQSTLEIKNIVHLHILASESTPISVQQPAYKGKGRFGLGSDGYFLSGNNSIWKVRSAETSAWTRIKACAACDRPAAKPDRTARVPVRRVIPDVCECRRTKALRPSGLAGSVANTLCDRSRPSAGRNQAASCCSSRVTTSDMAHGPTPNARSIMRFSPMGSRVRLKAAAWPFRRARITSNPLIVA